MSDLIERRAAIDAIESAFDRETLLNRFVRKIAISAVRLLPSAQPERKKGRWQEDPSGYGFWICSACGFVSEASGADLLYNFCPHCGADMRGEQDE